MRRVVIQNLRTLRRSSPRQVLQLRIDGPPSSNVTFQRFTSSRSLQPLQSAMRFLRRISIPIGLGVGAAALYYGYEQQRQVGFDRSASTSNSRAPGISDPLSNGFVPQTVPEAVRKALIVEQGQVFAAQIPVDQPISKETDFSRRKVLEILTPEQASAKLRTNEESYLVGRGEGVVRYDVVQIPSNDPIEDDHVEKILEVYDYTTPAPVGAKKASDWMFWGVFDGHAGWTTSAKLRQTLVSYVARELDATYKSASQDSKFMIPTPDAIDAAIKEGFLKLDTEITHESVAKVLKAQSKVVAAEILAPALSGSCALLSFYDSQSKELRVACAGDSRAVLGRRGNSGKWTATALSTDQTGSTPSEVARLRKEHPDEPYVTMNGRILGGLEPSRAFGDAIYKWSAGTQEQMRRKFFGRSPMKYFKTPPYVTAEPVVTRTKIEPANGDFVVMATDGLWELLTNEEVVGLVGQWLEKEASREANGGGAKAKGWLPSWFTGPKASSLPIEPHGQEDSSGHKAPRRQQQWGIPPGEAQRFVVKDKNVATHVVRNALGGSDEDMLSALLTLPAPYSRRYRDDLTVQVIFFGEGQGNGRVELNQEASATAAQRDTARPDRETV